jgi:proteasome accessory factor B
MTGVAPRAVPPEERLFSLVLALLATEQGLTKAEILSTVQGYSQRYARHGDNVALERQFERDKDDVRELGIPLETVDDPGDPGNNQTLRYRIPRGEYDLPAEVTFTPQELGLLNLAGRVWREGSLSGESRRALLKLGSLGIEPDEPLLGYAPRARVRDTAFDPLTAALDRGVLVRFDYLKPGDASARTRLVAPYALVQWQGRWLLYGREPDADVSKNFLLSRIVSRVETTTRRFEHPGGDQAALALASLQGIWRDQVAEVRVRPGTDAATRLAKRRGAERVGSGDGAVLRLHYSDLALLADELGGFGPEVEVLAPATLREAVRDRLVRVGSDHGAAAPAGAEGSRG